MKKRILFVLLGLMLTLTSACGTSGDSSSASQPEVDGPSEELDYYGDIVMFSVPSVKPGEAEYAASVEMTAGGSLEYDVTVEEGKGFFIACSTTDEDVVPADSVEWLYYCENPDGNAIKELVEITTDGLYHIYVGSLGEPLQYVSGNADWTVPEAR